MLKLNRIFYFFKNIGRIWSFKLSYLLKNSPSFAGSVDNLDTKKFEKTKEKVSFDDFLMTTWEPEKKEPEIPGFYN